MTTATITRPRLVASHNTLAGFAIGILRNPGGWLVVRMDDQSRYVALSAHTTETAARQQANREWSADMGRKATR